MAFLRPLHRLGCFRGTIKSVACNRSIGTTSSSLFPKIDDIERHDISIIRDKPTSDVKTISIDTPLDISRVSGVPDEHISKRHVRIYMPSRTAAQSGTNQTHKWRIEFDTRERWENPLMGWTSTGDPLSNMHVEFPDADSAAAFCEKNGWGYHIEDEKTRYIKPKSYGANFSWNKRTRRTAK